VGIDVQVRVEPADPVDYMARLTREPLTGPQVRLSVQIGTVELDLDLYKAAELRRTIAEGIAVAKRSLAEEIVQTKNAAAATAASRA